MALVLLDRSTPDPKMDRLSDDQLTALALGRAPRADDIIVVFADACPAAKAEGKPKPRAAVS